ncbi:mechanosensitive ion channel family protein [Natronobacterium gregoryi]|uniref:Mechanosensitive ion channel protein MscS n=2 Tax=Natronobacterium gregoryi TaxID=44930 RepID=L0ACK6_NATGS|nr:mechanosensitive ion channel domain-containing protein [Natronobacterium gregoryi]AFZ71618.1 small-conductance mechanosensitive channel [Natronobacterium gregoryi SP2]ELY66673.1 MscS Mechanosensitive ion channel [Natronobacterium gregoryi SP2]PLK21384.1 mechanosensitive ion channel protein MscS [Natronobacterium gregoryi SP2]SFI80329.1 Mechanosensitive ion channel [Natronobacterium gregoryi]
MEWQTFLEEPAVIAAAVLALGLVAGYLVGRLNNELLTAAGVPDAVEGTPFERTAQSIGTSTVEIVARLSSWFIYGIAVLTAIHIAQLLDTDMFWFRVVDFIPQLFVAVLVLILGFIIADKSELIVSEYLRGVKLPEVSLLPKLVKYSVLYVTFIIALAQIGIHVLALLILLAIYTGGLVVVFVVAFKGFLISSAAGIYLLLEQPYSIGDEIEIGDQSGIVQEVDLFVTKIENDSKEYIVPNRKVFEDGIVRLRE